MLASAADEDSRPATAGSALTGLGLALLGGALAATLAREPRLAAVAAGLATVVLTLVPGPGADDEPRRATARAFPRRALALLASAALALTIGTVDVVDGRGPAPLWLTWLATFSVLVPAYGDVVFARAVRAISATPTRFGARRGDGSVVGLDDPTPAWALPLAAPPLALPALLALYLGLEHARWVLVAGGAWLAAGMLFSSLARGRVIWVLDAPSRAAWPPPPRLSGPERRAHLRTGLEQARDTAFWGLVIARPLAAIWLYPIADVPWLTPNLVTVVSLATCLGAGAVGALAAPDWAWAAVALIFVRSVLDSFDGQLARYRTLSSHFGGYLDKVTDSFGWAALYAAAAAAGYAHTGEPLVLLAPMLGVTVLQFQGVTYWLERDMRPPSAPAPLTSRRSPLSLAGWLINWWRLAIFEEPDFYLWISLGLLTHEYRALALVIAVPFLARVTLLTLYRLHYARRLASGREA